MTPKEIVGALANEGGIEGRFIGQINLLNDFSTVELPSNLPGELLAALGRIQVRHRPLCLRPMPADETLPECERAFRKQTAPRREDKDGKPFVKPWKKRDDGKVFAQRKDKQKPSFKPPSSVKTRIQNRGKRRESK